ncbi:MAG: hypothetical protein QOD83_3318 [Solirubrobacteraceae bacterium]|jgi:hypothetical protein|nr:hypothetical protein [Solirubrobacteraceae bacterium]
MGVDEEADEPALHPKRIANPDAKCPKHPKKDWRPLVQRAWDAGWWCEWRSQYIRCWPKNRNAQAVSLPSTPSGSRSLVNYTKKMEGSGLPKL